MFRCQGVYFRTSGCQMTCIGYAKRLAYDSFPGKGSWRFIENYDELICQTKCHGKSNTNTKNCAALLQTVQCCYRQRKSQNIKIDISFVADLEIQKLLSEKQVSEKTILAFRTECKDFLCTYVHLCTKYKQRIH